MAQQSTLGPFSTTTTAAVNISQLYAFVNQTSMPLSFTNARTRQFYSLLGEDRFGRVSFFPPAGSSASNPNSLLGDCNITPVFFQVPIYARPGSASGIEPDEPNPAPRVILREVNATTNTTVNRCLTETMFEFTAQYYVSMLPCITNNATSQGAVRAGQAWFLVSKYYRGSPNAGPFSLANRLVNVRTKRCLAVGENGRSVRTVRLSECFSTVEQAATPGVEVVVIPATD